MRYGLASELESPRLSQLILAFAQLTFRESLRDIETCLQALGTKVYHCGIRAKTSRSTLADANEKRDWRIFADLAHMLIDHASRLYGDEDFGIELKEMAHALDSTTVDLCLSLFPLARFRRRKATIKLHTLLALRGSFLTTVTVTADTDHDVNILDHLQFAPGVFCLMDRGHPDFVRPHRIHRSGAFFVPRAKKNSRLRRARRGLFHLAVPHQAKQCWYPLPLLLGIEKYSAPAKSRVTAPTN